MNAWIKCMVLGLSIPLAAQAHRAWMLPSATVLSGDDAWVTVDAAVSNDLFYFEHNALKLDRLAIHAPDGSVVQPEAAHTGRYRSTFDLPLKQKGTYRLSIVNDGLSASYKLNGETKRWRGSAEALTKEIPPAAQELQVTRSFSRVDTFVTAGKPTDTVLEPTGKGLELLPLSHPNDLFAGEAARFRLQVDGKPAAGVKVSVVPGGIRYRDRLGEMEFTTDQDGQFSVTWPQPGYYWLQATVQDAKADKPATQRRLVYSATLEVLSQ